MQCGHARAFFLLERRSQLMIHESALPDFRLQHLIDRSESFNGIVQVPGGGRMVVENLTHSRRRLAVCGRVLHPGARRGYRGGGLLKEIQYMRALREHFRQDRRLNDLPGGASFRFSQNLGLCLLVSKRALCRVLGRRVIYVQVSAVHRVRGTASASSRSLSFLTTA